MIGEDKHVYIFSHWDFPIIFFIVLVFIFVEVEVQEREGTCILMADSPCCMAETNTTL